MRKSLNGVVAALLLAAPALARAEAGQVSYVDGKAFRQAGGKGDKVPLAKEVHVEQGDVLTTAARGRVEITLTDKSVLRLGPNSELIIEDAEVKDDARKVDTKLVLGNVWAKVSTALGGDNKFEVTTDRAVAGVRGTVFRVDAHKDKAVVVSVFSGAVAVAGNHLPQMEHDASASADPKTGKPKHTQVAGPTQVTVKEWEKLVGAQMKISVAADGTPGDPQKFAANEECADEWSRWNKERDGEPCAPKK
jgi:hypothetical protein